MPGGEPMDGANEPILNVRGDLVALGPLRRDLIPTYARWVNDLDTLRTLGTLPVPFPLEAEAAWYDAANTRHQRPFTIYECATIRPVGTCELRDVDHRNRTASIGMLIGEPTARGKGYGTEATRLLLDVAFTVHGLHSIWLDVFSYNLAGRRCYEKAGFREVGRRRECQMLDGVLYDRIVMDILATEFESPVLAKVFRPDSPRET